MSILITPDTTGLVRFSKQEYTAQASDLGLLHRAPRWPLTILTTLGNGQPLVRIYRDKTEARFRQAGGDILLRVFREGQ